MKIVIDPGHGGQDRSNRGPTGYIEADGVLDIGLKLRKLLEDEGYLVKMTRERDDTVSLIKRAEIANSWQADLFLSLHTNAATSTSANGIETFHSYNGVDGSQHREEAQQVARIIQQHLVNITGFRDRGIKTRVVENTSSSNYGRDYYSVLRNTKMPALIIEMGFHTNFKEEALLKTNEFRQKLAEALFEGVKEVYPLSNNNEQDNTEIKENENIIKSQMKVKMGGEEKVVNGFLLNNRFYLPIRFLEAFGYTITYDADNKVILINK